MKLVVATPLYPPELGGPATYAKLLEEYLPAEGIEIYLIKWSSHSGPKGIRHLRYFFSVLQAARHADAILALDPVSVGFPACLAALLARKHFFVKVVGDFAWEQGSQRFAITEPLDVFVQNKHVPVAVWLLRMVQTFVSRSATRVIVPSAYLKKIVSDWGIEPSKITIIYNSIQLPQLPEALRIEGSLVVTVGRLVPWKGITGVIDAVTEVHTSVPEASLLIVGDGPDRTSLEEHAVQKLGTVAYFTGPLAHREVLMTMQRARVLVLNSTYEGMSHVLIEALLLGCTVIATDAGGNTELITHEQNGLLVPVGDTAALHAALLRVLHDTSFADELGERARLLVSKFSVGTMIGDTTRLLTNLS